jgi:hypothetical protein
MSRTFSMSRLMVVALLPLLCKCECVWKELLPPPAVGCARIFVHEHLVEREPANFLVSLPHPQQCKTVHLTEPTCPNIQLPFHDDTQLSIVNGIIMNEEFNEPISPPEFVKLSLHGNSSFSHSVDMLPLGNNYYGFTLIPVEPGRAALSVNVDFVNCTDTHMLG